MLGGDIRAFWESLIFKGDRGNRPLARKTSLTFVSTNFRSLMRSFMDGIVMGGGVGFAGALQRIARRRKRQSPRAPGRSGSGCFFPDVVVTGLLSHSPGEVATYLCLHRFDS